MLLSNPPRFTGSYVDLAYQRAHFVTINQGAGCGLDSEVRLSGLPLKHRSLSKGLCTSASLVSPGFSLPGMDDFRSPGRPVHVSSVSSVRSPFRLVRLVHVSARLDHPSDSRPCDS